MTSPDTEPVLLIERRPPALWLTINRPDKLNAINGATIAGLRSALTDAEADQETRVVVLAGAGRAFSTGYDISESSALGPDGQGMIKATAWQWRSRIGNELDLTMQLFHLSKPTIAAVLGWVLAGACELIMACDLVIASDDATFGEPEIRYGAGPVALLMPFVLGMRKTKELLFTGGTIGAHEALRLGLVNDVVLRDDLESSVAERVAMLAAIPAAVMRMTKSAVNQAYLFGGLEHAVRFNLESTSILHGAATPEQVEFDAIVKERGLRAALDWRDSRFGRLSQPDQ